MVLATLGSAGDVNPFVGLGIALRRRGHRVTVVTNAHFERQIRGEGLAFRRMGTAAQYECFLAHPDVWDPQRSLDCYFDFAASVMVEGYSAIAGLHEPGQTVLGALHSAFAARIAHATLRVPLATLVVETPFLPSEHDAPRVLGSPDLADVRGRVNAFRATLGLPAIQDLNRWMTSPDLVIALWPDWYYAPQPDWPQNTFTTGFVEYDGSALDAPGPPPAALTAAEPAIVFTAGTGNAQAADFFATAAGVCEKLGRAGLLVTRHRSLLPAALPPRVTHVSYARFGALFSRAAAVVHHGGIGTTARALQAGVPQLVMPMAYDQFDNARRLCRLGVARWLTRKRFTVDAAAAALEALLGARDVPERCRRWAERLRQADPTDRACRLIESLAGAA